MSLDRITGVRVTHERAETSELNRLRRGGPARWLAVLDALDGVREAFAIETCLRIELYVVGDDAAGEAVRSAAMTGVPDDLIVETGHEDSVRHLLRVAVGFESFTTGEDRVLGQVREAYEAAADADCLGSTLERAALKALHVGERARDETAVNEGPTTRGAAALHLAVRDDGGDFEERTVAVVGADRPGRGLAQAIASRGVGRLLVADASRGRAAALANQISASVTAVDDVERAVRAADIVFWTRRDAHPMDTPSGAATEGTVFVDLSETGDAAAAADGAHATVYDRGDVAAVLDAARDERSAAVDRIEEMVEDATAELLAAYRRQRVEDVVAAMYRGAEDVKREQLSTALRALRRAGGLTDEQRDVVEALADALVAHLLAAPTASIRGAAAADEWETIGTAVSLFEPTFDLADVAADIDAYDAHTDARNPTRPP